MSWSVFYTPRTAKQVEKLPKRVQERLVALVTDIELNGPVRGNWPNFGKLSPSRFHCHLKKGRPTYIACWEQVKQEIKIVEIYYAGTHEKAPY